MHSNFSNVISVKRPRVKDFAEVVDSYTNNEFRENFRMYRTTFEHILALTKNKIAPDVTGRNPVTARHQLLFTIWYFSTPDSYRYINFKLAKSVSN